MFVDIYGAVSLYYILRGKGWVIIGLGVNIILFLTEKPVKMYVNSDYSHTTWDQ